MPKLKDIFHEFPHLANARPDDSCLYEAVHRDDNMPMLELLFNTKGFNFIIKDYGATQYHSARLEILKMMVKKYPLGIHVLNRNLESPLHCACEKNDEGKVEFLLQQPLINVKIKNEDGKLAEDLTTSDKIKQMFVEYRSKKGMSS